MDTRQLGPDKFELVYQDGSEREVMAEACVSAVEELVRQGEAEYGDVINNLVSPLLDMGNRAPAESNAHVVTAVELGFAKEALRMYSQLGKRTEAALEGFPEATQKLHSQFAGRKIALQNKAGTMFMQLSRGANLPALESSSPALPSADSPLLLES